MATTSSHPAAARLLTVGVELEIELKPKPNLHEKHAEIFQAHEHYFAQFAAIIGTTLDGSNFNTSCIAEGSTEYQQALGNGTIHQYWNVVSEPIAATQDGNWVLELVSRALQINPTVADQPHQPPWFEEIQLVWDIIAQNFDVVRNPDCGTHVHFKQVMKTPTSPEPLAPTSPEPFAPYYLEDLRAVVKGIVSWENAVALCIPKFRRDNPNAISNVNPPAKKHQMTWTAATIDYKRLGAASNAPKFSTLFEKIDRYPTVEDLANYVGGIGNSRTRNKYLAWNFAHIGDARKINTVEFRRPPMAKNPEETLHWITLVASFAAAAPGFNFSQQLGTRYQAPLLPEFETTYLVHGLSEVPGATEEQFLQIHEFAGDPPAPGGGGGPSGGGPGPTPPTNLAVRSAPQTAGEGGTPQPSFRAHVLSALAPAASTALQPAARGMLGAITGGSTKPDPNNS